MQKPTIEDMKRQLQDIPVRKKSPPSSLIPPLSAPPRLTQEGVFLGFIIEKEPVRPFRSDSDVERDGGGLSKNRDPVSKKEGQLRLISTPKGERPGRIEVYNKSGSKTVEFYADERILEATDNGDVVTAVVFDRDPKKGEFSLESKDTKTNSYKMVNANNYCICLGLKDNQPELISLREDEIKRETNIIQFLTVFQYNAGSAEHNIAIFFSYGNEKKKYNCYLIPQASDTQVSCKVCLKIIDVTDKSPDEQRVIHHEYIRFSMNPETSTDYTDDAEPEKHHHILSTSVAEAKNGVLTQSYESSASGGSSDSGQGSSIKDSNGERGEGVGGEDQSETSSLEQS